jgi:hypothetical protein
MMEGENFNTPVIERSDTPEHFDLLVIERSRDTQ